METTENVEKTEMKPIDEAEEIMKKSDKVYVIITEDDENGMQMRIRYSYKFGLASIAAIADTIMTDHVPQNGYLVHADLRNVLERTMTLSKAEPDKEIFEKDIEELRKIFAKYRIDKSPEEFFEDLRDGKNE